MQNIHNLIYKFHIHTDAQNVPIRRVFVFISISSSSRGYGIAKPGVGLAGDKGMMPGWVRSRILRI
jgi:hypothetical protein